jgi:geranylgeranyl diphosphate synthase, type II
VTPLSRYFEDRALRVERALRRWMPPSGTPPAGLHQAMRYSLFAGGKRLRPVLCLAAAELCGGMKASRRALPAACALEMIHTYSLVHDDLPAMDDDDLRRGRPTCHIRFGEAEAILAGDALLTDAFAVMARCAGRGVPAARVTRAVSLVARAAGSAGMVGGQMADLLASMKSEGRSSKDEIWKSLKGPRSSLRPSPFALRTLAFIHRRKTGALIKASLLAGAVLGGGDARRRKALARYGEHIGLAFQIADDVLDIVGDKELLGKRGSDQKNRKLTFPSVHGLETSRAMARREVAKAKSALKMFGPKADMLRELADYIVDRDR